MAVTEIRVGGNHFWDQQTFNPLKIIVHEDYKYDEEPKVSDIAILLINGTFE